MGSCVGDFEDEREDYIGRKASNIGENGINLNRTGIYYEIDGFNHSLKNKKAFSTLKNQKEGFSKEGLLRRDQNGAREDRRTKIEFVWNKPASASFASLCQLAGSMTDSLDGIGSCCMIEVGGVPSILTSALNMITKSALTGNFLEHKCGYMYQMRQGEDAWLKLWKLEINKMRVHPRYDGEEASGFDIAVCPVVRQPHEFDLRVRYSKLTTDCQWISVDPADIKVGYEIEVGGYPGEKNGYPHVQRGKIKHIKRTKEGGCILFYDVDTTPGNSGSPIWMVDERFFDDFKNKNKLRKGITKFTIGIHSGHSVVDMLNYGILTTPAIQKWMENR